MTALEVGSFEGRSACWMLEHLLGHPDSRLYCVDTFEGSEEFAPELREGLLERFTHNVRQTGRGEKVQALVGRSDDVLVGLIGEGVRADLAYVDGSHRAAEVLTDAVLCWKLLKPGGVMVFDDHLWRCRLGPDDLLLHPKLAVDGFVNAFFDRVDLLDLPGNAQVAVRKRPTDSEPGPSSDRGGER